MVKTARESWPGQPQLKQFCVSACPCSISNSTSSNQGFWDNRWGQIHPHPCLFLRQSSFRSSLKQVQPKSPLSCGKWCTILSQASQESGRKRDSCLCPCYHAPCQTLFLRKELSAASWQRVLKRNVWSKANQMGCCSWQKGIKSHVSQSTANSLPLCQLQFAHFLQLTVLKK